MAFEAFTQAQVQRVCVYARAARIAELLPHLNASLAAADVTTSLRAAMYLAQLAHESRQLRALVEIGSGAAYDLAVNPRLARKLGNVLPGDGPRFKGRGAIQLTGRSNYRDAGKDLGLPLEEQPELAAAPENGFRVSAWYWRRRHLNEPADAGDVEEATRRINGGLGGLEQREELYDRARAALGC